MAGLSEVTINLEDLTIWLRWNNSGLQEDLTLNKMESKLALIRQELLFAFDERIAQTRKNNSNED